MHSPNPSWVEMLVAVTAAYVTARLIQAEAPIGVNQFWITRPYRWRSLLAAKLLFILVFIHLPVLAARFVVLVLAKLPLAASLPGLLWSQLLMLLTVSFSLAALAAVTAGLVPFIFSILFLLGCGFVIQEMTVPPSIPAVERY